MKQKEEKGALVLQVFKKIFLLLFSFLFISKFSFSNEIDYKVIGDIEKYLNNITYLKVNFLQDDIKNSKLSEGIFYLHRPNKLKIDYTNPFKASLDINDKRIIYYDKELDEKYSLKTAKTPLKFFLRKKIELTNKNLKIVSFKNDKENIEIGIQEKNNSDGILYLKFTKNPISLSNMILKSKDEEVNLTFIKKDINIEDIFNYE